MGTVNIDGEIPRNVYYGRSSVNTMYYADELIWERPDVEFDFQENQNGYPYSGTKVQWISELDKFYTIALYSSKLYILSSSTGLSNSWTAVYGSSYMSGPLLDWDYDPTNGVFIVVDGYENIYTSATGSSWNTVATDSTSAVYKWSAIKIYGSRIYLFGQRTSPSTSPYYTYSNNLTTWTKITLPSTYSARVMVHIPYGILVKLGGGIYLISGSTITATPMTGGLAAGIYISSLDGGKIYIWDGTNRYTYNGATNTISNTVSSILPDANQYNNMCYSKSTSTFIYKSGSTIYSSDDGIIWDTIYKSTSYSIDNEGFTYNDNLRIYTSMDSGYTYIT